VSHPLPSIRGMGDAVIDQAIELLEKANADLQPELLRPEGGQAHSSDGRRAAWSAGIVTAGRQRGAASKTCGPIFLWTSYSALT
jgi:hypothetical protein